MGEGWWVHHDTKILSRYILFIDISNMEFYLLVDAVEQREREIPAVI